MNQNLVKKNKNKTSTIAAWTAGASVPGFLSTQIIQ